MPDRQELAVSREQHLLMRDEPGQADGVDRRLASHHRCGRARRSGGSVALRLVMKLDDLGTRKVTRRLGREPHHQHRTEREVRGVEAGNAGFARNRVDAFVVEARGPYNGRDTACGRRLDIPVDRVRHGEIDYHLRPVKRDELVSRPLEGGRVDAADLAAATVERDYNAELV